MSGAIGSSSYGGLDRMLASTTALRDQYAVLQQQTTTGKVAQSYAGLAPQAAQIFSLTAATDRSNTYMQTIASAQGKASVMQDALSQIGTLVSSMTAGAIGISAASPVNSVGTVAQQASLAMTQIAALLNSTYGGDYVFAGADTTNPPVTAPDSVTSSGMFSQIGAQVAALATVPTTPPVGQVIANTVAIAASPTAGTTIFSAYLTGANASAAPGTIPIADNQQVSLDLPANRNAGAVSDPAIAGTGNAISDVMRSLAVLANSTGAMAANPDFTALVKNVVTTLQSAGATLAQESGSIGITQQALTKAATAQGSMQVILAKQLSGLTDVDMASAISKLQAVGSQLQASYSVLGQIRSLNLASFL
jgi:flagellar hook-associated protein 3 FlgL